MSPISPLQSTGHRKTRGHITGSPLFLASDADSIQNQKSDDLMLQFENLESEILKQTIAQISPELIDELTTALLKARNLGFMGFRNSHYFAGYARWQFIQFQKQTRLIPGPGETVAERIADLNERDIVVVIGIRRIVGKIKRYLEVLRQNNVRILLITDPSAHVAPAYAQWTISCPVENPHVFDS